MIQKVKHFLFWHVLLVAVFAFRGLLFAIISPFTFAYCYCLAVRANTNIFYEYQYMQHKGYLSKIDNGLRSFLKSNLFYVPYNSENYHKF